MVDPEKIRNPREIKDPYYIKDPTLFELYKKCVPPKEAYYYFPQGEEIMIPHKKPPKALRRIYVNTPYTDLENKWIEDYKKIIMEHPENKLPDYWDDSWNLTFIYSMEADLPRAYTRMMKYLKWLDETFPYYIQPGDSTCKLLNNGSMYIYGRDHQFRPIIVVQPHIIAKDLDKFSSEDIVRASIFLCQFAANNMLIPGQVENWIMFINLKGLNILSIPEPIKKLIIALSDNFLAKLYKSYILHLSAFLRLIYNIAKAFLEEITVRKFVILDGTKDKRLFTDIAPQNLEKKFGGTAPDTIADCVNSLFPPRMPSSYFFKEDEDPEKILITEKEYILKIKGQELPEKSISPYIKEKLEKERIKEEQRKKEEEERERKKEENKMNLFKRKKTKRELTCDTDWKVQKEMFDLNTIKNQGNKNLFGDIKNFTSRQKNFFSTISILSRKGSERSERSEKNQEFFQKEINFTPIREDEWKYDV